MFHNKEERDEDKFFDYAEEKYEGGKLYINEYTTGEIDGFIVQGAYEQERWNQLSRTEKIQAILSYPNTIFQSGEIYYFDGTSFSKVIIS